MREAREHRLSFCRAQQRNKQEMSDVVFSQRSFDDEPDELATRNETLLKENDLRYRPAFRSKATALL